MNELVSIRLRTLVWLLLPLVVLLLIPWSLRHVAHQSFEWHWGLLQWLGVWLIANGVGLCVCCVNLFNVEGRGTPLPLDPPKRFVTRGPYRYVRNPMMLGAFLILAGESAAFESWVLFLYTFLIMTLAHLFVRFWEEPDLARRFGEAYRQYVEQVPRWLPRKPQVRKS